MKFFKFFVLTLLCVCLTAGSVFAQRLTGKITGTVSDTDGAPLPGVTVEISSQSLMGGVQAQITSDRGHYRFINLPPGTYTLVFKLEGFQTLERENVKLSIGKTVNENMVLQQATLKESVTVTAAAPIVDVTQSGISHVFSRDDLEKLPLGRDSVYDVIKFAPGLLMTTQETSRIVAFGSNSESNSFRVDGVELSSPGIGIGWVSTTQEAFEEVETLGMGAPAEYGSFTGAVVNVVTKSGGNSFHGALAYYGQFDALTADNNPWKVLDPSVPPEEALNYPDSAYSYHRDKYLSAAINLGGPIVKDRLWFYGTFERQDEKSSGWNIYPDYAVSYPANKAFFKLSAQLADRHKLAGSIYWEDNEWPDSPVYWVAQSSLGIETAETWSWNFLYTWQLSNSAFFELKYAGYHTADDYLPQSGDLDTPPHFDWGTGWISGGCSDTLWLWTEYRHQAHANLSYFADDFLGGDHEFKVGVQYYHGDSRYSSAYAGEGYFYDYYGVPYYFYQRDVYYVGSAENSFGAFVDDSWKIGDRLTLNLGFRFDSINAYVPELPIADGWTGPSGETSPAVKDLINWNSFSPRIGLVFQITSDQKTLLKATYGRYYDKDLMDNWNYPGPNVTDLNVYYYDWDLEDYVLWYTLPAESTFVLDPGLKHPYADLFSVGLERELLPDFAISATYVYKTQRNLIGLIERAGIYEQVSMVSEDNGQTYTLFNQTNVGTAEHFITNPPDYKQTYQAVMLTLYKRYSHNWMLNASLTYSKSEGLNNLGKATGATQQAIIWYGDYLGRDPNDYINAYGRMPSDRPWILKVQAGYSFPWDIMASFNWIYQTGRPYLSFTRFRLNQGFRKVITEPRGDNRLPDWSVMDIRLEKTFNIGDRVKFQAIFDLWNVFNANTVTGYASYDMWRDRYMEPGGIFWPRRLQIGLRLQF
jgi:outer membrane receptor protein involved in Fe transport